MADDTLLQRLGAAAVGKLPPALQRGMQNATFRGEQGPTQSIASGSRMGNLAGVMPGQNTINIMDGPAFQKNADQLTAHEGMHVWQNNLPPTMAAQIPADNAADPYNFGGLAGLNSLRAKGGTILNMPKEQQASMMQYRTSQGGDKAPAAVRQATDPFIQDMNKLPLSQIDPTDPQGKGINMHPRAPITPVGVPGMMYAQRTYKKGDSAPGGDIFDQIQPDKAQRDIFDEIQPDDAPPQVKPFVPAMDNVPPIGSSVGDTLSTVGQHFKNMVAGPYHAVMDAPQSQAEQDVVNAGGGGKFGRAGLAADRLLGVSASQQNAQDARQQFREGKNEAGFQSAMDAVPFVGPWARQIENDTRDKGAVAGMAGLATDVFGPAAAGRVVGLAAKPLARSAAVADVKNMIRPTANDSAFGKAPAEGLLNQPGGVVSMSKPSLLARTKANIAATGQQIGSTVAHAPQVPIDVSGAVTGPFDTALQSAAKSNQTGLYGRLQETKQGLTRDLFHDPTTDTIQGQMNPRNLNMTPSDLFDMKKGVGDNIKWTNQAFDNDLNATQGQVYGGLKDALNQAVPELKPLNEQYANMRSGASALERRIPIEERNNHLSLGDTAIGTAGGALGGGIGAGAAVAGKKLITSQPFRSLVDQGLWKYGNSASKGLYPSPYRLLFAPPTGSKSF